MTGHCVCKEGIRGQKCHICANGKLLANDCTGQCSSLVSRAGQSIVVPPRQSGLLLVSMWSFWPIFSGQSLVSLSSVTGQSLVSHWPVTGQSLVSHWSVTGQSLVSLWSVSGQSLASLWPVTVIKLRLRLGQYFG